MAQVKGEFLADFASFYDAVTKAEVSLDGLETNAAKVEKALDRATNAFSGTKLIQDATIATEAVKALGGGLDVVAGATKLTTAEQTKLNAQVTEAIAKYNALGKEAPADMVALQKATAATVTEAKKLQEAANAPPAQGKAAAWMSDFTSQVTGMAAGMISAQAVIGGFQAAWSGLVSFVGSSVKEFSEAEAGEKRLAVALEGINQATPRATGYMADLAEQFSNTTKYSGGLITEMEALLVTVGQVLPADMKGALTAATDLASGLGIDLEQATTAVAKAFAGNSDSLRKFGIDINDARLQAEGMPYVLDAINERVGGQAQGEMDTYAGKVEAMGNKWDDVKESFGEIIVRSPLVSAALDGVTGAVGKTDTGITDLDHGLSSLIEKFTLFGSRSTFSEGIRTLEDWSIAVNEANWARKQFESAPVSENESIRLGTLKDQQRSLAMVTEELKKGEQATKDKKKADTDAAAEVKKHAQEIENLRDKLSSDGATKAAQLYVEALAGVKDVGKLTATAQKEIADEVWKGLEAYKALGQTAPAAMRELYAAVMAVNDIKITTGIDNLSSALGATAVKATELDDKVTAAFEKQKATTAAALKEYNDLQKAAYDAAMVGVGGLDAMGNKAVETTAEVNQITVAMNTLLGVNRSAWESVAAGHELMNAYSAAGIAMGSQLAMGGYNASMRQRAGIPTSQDVYGYQPGAPSGGAWGNSLTVNVNNADAQGIASKLVTEMRHSGYRF